jgi:hypothetical protein
MANKTEKQERLVVVLTEFREIFCGWATDVTGDRIQLRNAKQACYYSEDTHGLLGLAVNGPGKGSRIGPAANMEVRRVVNVIECQSVAVDAWENAKWTR